MQRPRAYEQCVMRRAVIDAYDTCHPLDLKGNETTPFFVGDSILCRGQPGTISSFASGVYLSKEEYASSGGVTIAFEMNGEEALVDYTSIGKGKGGARLQRVAPSLRPPPRATPSFAYSDELRERVLTTYHAECATSPHASDSKRKRLAPHVYITAQALIVMSGLQSIYDSHLRRFPSDKGKVSFAGFKEMKPWYAIFGDRQTCLCKHCENFLCYQDGLRVAATFLATLLYADPAAAAEGDDATAEEPAAEPATTPAAAPATSATAPDAAPDADADQPTAVAATQPTAAAAADGDAGKLHLTKLVRVAQLKSKQMFVNEFVCGGCISTAKHDCIMGTCNKCGFDTLWGKGLRKEVVDAYGKLKPGADKVWLTKVKWERIKSSAKANTTGEPPKPDEKEMLRERCEGTIIDLLDEFEKHVMPKYPFHRQTLNIQKQADQQREDNLPPLVLDVDSDHSENGTIANAREIQSEYWVAKLYSLFISIWSYLCSKAWVDRVGALPKGTAVTLEPEGASRPGSLELLPGSVYAVVEEGSTIKGEETMYHVRERNGPLHRVPRERLRRRQRRTVAFACICNEKRHDAPTTQHFLNRILAYFHGHPTPAPGPPAPAPQPTPYQFDLSESFWGLIHHSDNATHFKSNKMLHFCGRLSRRGRQHRPPRLLTSSLLSLLLLRPGEPTLLLLLRGRMLALPPKLPMQLTQLHALPGTTRPHAPLPPPQPTSPPPPPIPPPLPMQPPTRPQTGPTPRRTQRRPRQPPCRPSSNACRCFGSSSAAPATARGHGTASEPSSSRPCVATSSTTTSSPARATSPHRPRSLSTCTESSAPTSGRWTTWAAR